MKNKREIEENKELIEKYPFLLPRNVWTDEVIEDYDYSFTLLDDLPRGWKKRFGVQFCEDLKQELDKFNFVDKYRVVQIKEKYGEMRWYSNGSPVECRESEIIAKYARISTRTCIRCGKFPVPVIDDGWISPECKECWNDNAPIRMTKSYEDFITDNSPFDPIIKFTRFSKEGEETFSYDATDIVEKIKD